MSQQPGPVSESVASGQLDEATLVARSQDGDPEAFEQLVERYQLRVYRLALSMLADRGSAEDVVQETFITIWRRLPGLHVPQAFPQWTYQITTRYTLTALRSRRRHPEHATDPDQLTDREQPATTNPGAAADPADQITHSAQVEALQAAINQLPEDLRLCWILHTDHGRSYTETAHILGIPFSTVRGRIARARHQLVKAMMSWT